ncbi:hypothetical protein ABK040_006480 [Willaertia magna]
MKTKEHILFDILPEEGSDENQQQSLKKRKYERVIQLLPEEETLIIELNDKVNALEYIEVDEGDGFESIHYIEANPLDVYNDETVLLNSSKAIFQKDKPINIPTDNPKINLELEKKNYNEAYGKEFLPFIERKAKLQVDTIDMNELRRPGVICLTEKKRRKRDVIDLSNFHLKNLVVEKILKKRTKKRSLQSNGTNTINTNTIIKEEVQVDEFLVQWKGWPSSELMWVNYNICNKFGSRVLKEFLRKNNVKEEMNGNDNNIISFEEVIQHLASRICDILQRDAKLSLLDETPNLNFTGSFIREILLENIEFIEKYAKIFSEKRKQLENNNSENVSTFEKEFERELQYQLTLLTEKKVEGKTMKKEFLRLKRNLKLEKSC